MFRTAVVLLAATLSAQQLEFEVAKPLALTGATVHTGDGGTPIANAVVLLRDGRIEAVGPAADVHVPEGYKVVDAEGRHVTPGLIDTHVHYSQTGWADGRPDAANVRKDHPYELAMAENAAHPERFHRAFLHSGVTAVFDVGGYPWTRLLGAATEDDPLAPHVAATGALLATFDPGLSLPDQSQFVFPKSPDDGRSLVRSHAAWGSKAIKVWLIPTPEHPLSEWEPIVLAIGEAAREADLPLVVHATTLDTAALAVRAGAHLLVHSVEDQEVDDAFVAALREHETFYCPTLTVRRGYAQLYARQLSDEVRRQLDDVHPSIKKRVLATEQLPQDPRMNARAIEAMNKRLELQDAIMARNLMRVHQAGVPVVLGTDAGNPLTLHGPSVFVELEAMQADGMKASAVLVAATRDAARAMGRGDDLGRIEPGYIADLLVLEEDPSRDVRAFRSVSHVIRAGHMHARASLLPR
ncbi:MAG TPA: amidohydrolase family protein [Planctomycetota bacterium]|nr:amidohydrolase family protein [Planctomycetota bacterium]